MLSDYFNLEQDELPAVVANKASVKRRGKMPRSAASKKSNIIYTREINKYQRHFF